MIAASNGWPLVRFGDIAQSITDRVADPTKAGVERYIGLEHLDSDSLRIARWGAPTDVQATKLRFETGDVIFGRRRAYQRKVALADFDGICSAHALVLRAKPEFVLPEFLPLFMQSEVFFDRALSISVGSLSPTINWRTLAKQEFELPPLDEQKSMAALLWSAEHASERLRRLARALQALLDARLRVAFSTRQLESGWRLLSLRDCAEVRTGLAKGRRYSRTPTRMLPYLRVANVQQGRLDLAEIKEIEVAEDEVDRYALRHGDVLLTEGGDFDKLGRGTLWLNQIEPCLHQNHIFCVRPDPSRLLPDFLSLQTASSYGRRYFLSCAKRTTNLASINARQVKQFPLLLPPIAVQQRLITDAHHAMDARSRAESEIESLDRVRRALSAALIRSTK